MMYFNFNKFHLGTVVKTGATVEFGTGVKVAAGVATGVALGTAFGMYKQKKRDEKHLKKANDDKAKLLKSLERKRNLISSFDDLRKIDEDKKSKLMDENSKLMDEKSELMDENSKLMDEKSELMDKYSKLRALQQLTLQSTNRVKNEK